MPTVQVAAINLPAGAFLFFYPEHATPQYLLYKNIWLGQTMFRQKLNEDELQALLAAGRNGWEEVGEVTRRELQAADLSGLVRNLKTRCVWPENATASIAVSPDCSGRCSECRGCYSDMEPVTVER